jgi:hypothetical protein
MLRGTAGKPGGPDRRNFVAVLGRFKDSRGRISEVALPGPVLRKVMARLRPGEGVERMLDLAAAELTRRHPPRGRPIAFFALGIGPQASDAPAGDIWKGIFNEEDHPRWSAGAPDSQGGRFRPKDGSKGRLSEDIKRLAARRYIRTSIIVSLQVGVGIAVGLIPGAGEIADIAMLPHLIGIAAEFHELSIETEAAVEFAKKGPYSLDDLRVSPDHESFSSYAEFKKSPSFDEWLEKRFGSAGAGFEYHHIVEQGSGTVSDVPPDKLHSTDNVIRLPTLVHEAVTGEYNKASDVEGLTVREWLRTQPYDVQRAEGLKILRKLGIVR